TRPVGAAAVFFADARGHAPQAIGVLPEPGVRPIALAATLRSALPSTVAVRTGDSRGLGEFAGVSGSRLRLILVAGVFGGLVLVVMALVVAGTMTVSLRQRHRELALLRASGATPFQVRRLVLDETLLVALVGVLGGLALGRLAGARLFDALTDHGVVPSAVRFAQGPIPLAAAAIVALVTVRVAAGLAARPAVLVRPVQALREAAIAPGRLAPLRLWLAAVLAVGTVGLAGTTMFMTPTNAAALGGPAELTGAIAVGLVAPSVVRRAAAWFSRFVRRSGPDVGLAAVNLDVRAAQFGAVLTPIVLATSIALGNVYSQTTQDAATRAAYLDPLRADVVVTGDVGGIDPALAARLSALPGVTGSAELSDGSGWIEQPFDHSHTS
ncbi:MAG: ABC transporter permease, partial [Actinobacteria bacterium]|nr:ABC transporter permease [Actinomycetota bacterium]